MTEPNEGELPMYPHQHCPACGSDDWIMEVPNDPDDRVFCANPTHYGSPAPEWNPWL